MRLSVSLFLTDILPQKRKLYHHIIKNKFFDTTPVPQGLKELKEAGISGVELFLPPFLRINEKDILAAEQVLSESGLSILSIHEVLRFFTKTSIAEVSRLFAIAHEVGAKVVVLHLNAAGRQVFDPHYLSRIHALEKKYGIRAGFENAERRLSRFHKKYLWEGDRFASFLRSSDLSITLDTTHLAHSGGDIVQFVKRYSDTIVDIHLSDYKYHPFNTTLRPLRYKHMPLGKGSLPIKEFLRVLQKRRYKGLITMEIHTDLRGICENARFIGSVFHV